MRIAAVAVYATVAVIVGLTLVSGPPIGVEFTRESDDLSGLGTGNVSVDRVEAPGTAELAAESGSGAYYLEVPDAVINVTGISGRPIVAYRLEIRALGYARATSHFLDESRVGPVRLSVERDTLSPESVETERYDGTLSIVARYNETERVLYRDSIAVDVTN